MSFHEECACVKGQNSFVFSYYHVFAERLKSRQGLRSKGILSRCAEKFYLSIKQYFLLVMLSCRAGLASVRHCHRIMEVLDARIAAWVNIAF